MNTIIKINMTDQIILLINNIRFVFFFFSNNDFCCCWLLSIIILGVICLFISLLGCSIFAELVVDIFCGDKVVCSSDFLKISTRVSIISFAISSVIKKSSCNTLICCCLHCERLSDVSIAFGTPASTV